MWHISGVTYAKSTLKRRFDVKMTILLRHMPGRDMRPKKLSISNSSFQISAFFLAHLIYFIIYLIPLLNRYS